MTPFQIIRKVLSLSSNDFFGIGLSGSMMAVLALAVLYECLSAYHRYLSLSDSKIPTPQATSKYKRFGCQKRYILNRSFAWWRYFTTKTRMLCKNAFLSKFVFSLGNKETIEKLAWVVKWRHHTNGLLLQGRSQGRSWGARDPPFCKAFLSKQPTTGGENVMTISWP